MDDKPVVAKTELDCWQEEAPICPYCGTEEDEQNVAFLGDKAEATIDCAACNETYFVEVLERRVYTTHPFEGWAEVRINKKNTQKDGVH